MSLPKFMNDVETQEQHLPSTGPKGHSENKSSEGFTNTGPPGVNYQDLTSSKEEEDLYDIEAHIAAKDRTSTVGSVANLMKGALGAGILGAHVAFMKGGVLFSVPFLIVVGFYIGYSLNTLIDCAHILYKRCRVPEMSYSEIMEASVACFPIRRIAKLSKAFRYVVDVIICMELFGACATYQVLISKTIKQLVENTQLTSLHGQFPGYPDLRVYMAVMIIPIALICLIPRLSILSYMSMVANGVVLCCIMMAVYYAFALNPTFAELRLPPRDLSAIFEAFGTLVFSMSCCGVCVPVCNNMRRPTRYRIVLLFGHIGIGVFVMSISFFGYVAFREHSDTPITLNFHMTLIPKLLKGCIAFMIYATHALNFHPPFVQCFHYIKPKLKGNIVHWELFFRAVFAIAIGILAIVFPDINALMSFLGAFCLSNMAFIYPHFISIMVHYKYGYGRMKYKLVISVILLTIGVIVCIVGTINNARALFHSMSFGK